MSFLCVLCDRTFNSDEALQQHRRDAPAHASYCTTCDRHFSNATALVQHLRHSPKHNSSFDCEDCDRSFNSEEALSRHLRDSPVHVTTFDCETCVRSFGSEEALKQHLRDSRTHQQETETPLDVFFRSFPSFDYDPSLSPATSYAKLQKHERWQRGDAASKDAWNRYQDALESELRMWFGAEDDLVAWHSLCRAVGVEPLPQTSEQCEKV